MMTWARSRSQAIIRRPFHRPHGIDDRLNVGEGVSMLIKDLQPPRHQGIIVRHFRVVILSSSMPVLMAKLTQISGTKTPSKVETHNNGILHSFLRNSRTCEIVMGRGRSFHITAQNPKSVCYPPLPRRALS